MTTLAELAKKGHFPFGEPTKKAAESTESAEASAPKKKDKNTKAPDSDQ
jgi:hypothetical protein